MQKPLAGTLIKPGHPLSQGLVTAHLFNTGFGDTLYDYAPNKPWLERNHGTFINAPAWVSTGDGIAIYFNGANQKIDVGDIDNDWGNGFTYLCHFNANQTAAAARLIEGSDDNNSGITILVLSDILKFRIGTGATFVDKNYAFTDTTMFHTIAATWDGSSWVQYLDGDYLGEGAAASYGDTSSHMLGGRVVKSTQGWQGEISRSIGYNRVLSAAEIMELCITPYAAFRQQQHWPWFAPTVGVSIPLFMRYYRNMRMN